jgi:hypothetical protein
MEYRHNPPSLAELRKLRKEVDERRKNSLEPKKGLFSKDRKDKAEAVPSRGHIDEAELNRYEHDMILAHLENQNELLLELVRKIDRK